MIKERIAYQAKRIIHTSNNSYLTFLFLKKMSTKMLFLNTMFLMIPLSQSFTPSLHSHLKHTKVSTTSLYVASLSPRQKQNVKNYQNMDNDEINIVNTSNQIDNELSQQNPDPEYIMSSSSILTEMHSILDDGHGHMNKELATSIWTWENDNLLEQQQQKSVSSSSNDLFPLASKLNYSTRDGLRLIETIISNEIMEYTSIDTVEQYNDLVQEGVVALMKSMVLWDNNNNNNNDEETHDTTDAQHDFQHFASKEIRKSLKKCLRETLDGVGVMKMNLDLLRKRVEDMETATSATAVTAAISTNETTTTTKSSKQQLDQIVKPLSEAVLDENPTPDEIALSEMIRHDIGDFLQRSLNPIELKVIQMKFGLDGGNNNMGTTSSSSNIALHLNLDEEEVQQIERDALLKLRDGFSKDYIAAYLDDDNTEEVSL